MRLSILSNRAVRSALLAATTAIGGLWVGTANANPPLPYPVPAPIMKKCVDLTAHMSFPGTDPEENRLSMIDACEANGGTIPGAPVPNAFAFAPRWHDRY
jgi:hypothetical protein